MRSARYLLFISVILLIGVTVQVTGTVTAGQEIQWEEHNDGFKKARKEGKPIFMDFYAECRFCAVMENSTYTSDEIIEKCDDFVCIRVNGVEQPDRLEEYNIDIYPTMIFLMPDGTELGRLKGYVNDTYLLEQMDKADVMFNERYDPSLADPSSLDDNDGNADNEGITGGSGLLALIVVIAAAAVVTIIIGLFLRRKNK